MRIRKYVSSFGLVKLPTSDEKLQLFLEASPHSVVATRPDGRIAVVNTQMEKLSGYSRKELLGRKVEVSVPERFELRHLKKWAPCLNDLTVRSMSFEMFGRRKDGTEFPIEVDLGSWEAARKC